jgi:hypothetical protein
LPSLSGSQGQISRILRGQVLPSVERQVLQIKQTIELVGGGFEGAGVLALLLGTRRAFTVDVSRLLRPGKTSRASLQRGPSPAVAPSIAEVVMAVASLPAIPDKKSGPTP